MTIKGGGPIGTLVCVGDHGSVRACCDHPGLKLPFRADGKLDVGGAVGHNPVSIIIPCHRVIGADGNMTGYAGGISRKIRLLELEKNGL